MASMDKVRNEVAFLRLNMRASAAFHTRQDQTIVLMLQVRLDPHVGLEKQW
jgi:hypothetical protein